MARRILGWALALLVAVVAAPTALAAAPAPDVARSEAVRKDAPASHDEAPAVDCDDDDGSTDDDGADPRKHDAARIALADDEPRACIVRSTAGLSGAGSRVGPASGHAGPGERPPRG